MGQNNKDRELIYNRNEKRINDTHAKHNKAKGEDATKYGEFIPTFHQWLPIGEQKEKAEELKNATKD